MIIFAFVFRWCEHKNVHFSFYDYDACDFADDVQHIGAPDKYEH